MGFPREIKSFKVSFSNTEVSKSKTFNWERATKSKIWFPIATPALGDKFLVEKVLQQFQN